MTPKGLSWIEPVLGAPVLWFRPASSGWAPEFTRGPRLGGPAAVPAGLCTRTAPGALPGGSGARPLRREAGKCCQWLLRVSVTWEAAQFTCARSRACVSDNDIPHAR